MERGNSALNAFALGLSYKVAVKTAVPTVIFILVVEGVLFEVPLFWLGVASSSLLHAKREMQAKHIKIAVAIFILN
jgi:Sec-independent protein secretion pathway component TatC